MTRVAINGDWCGICSDFGMWEEPVCYSRENGHADGVQYIVCGETIEQGPKIDSIAYADPELRPLGAGCVFGRGPMGERVKLAWRCVHANVAAMKCFAPCRRCS